MEQELDTRNRWGRSRLGGSTKALIFSSLGIGLVLAIGAGVVFAALKFSDKFVPAMLIFGALMLPMLAVCAWALLVDRNTIKDAAKNPEISVESQWYDRAAVGVFQDFLMVCGLGAGVMTFLEFSGNIGLVLAVLVALMMLDFMVRYWLIKRKDS